MPITKVLGIDPGLNKTGYALLEKKKENLILKESGVLYSKSKSFEIKIFEIVSEIEKIIKKNNPEKLGIEDVFRGTNTQSALKSAHLKGAIIYLAIKNNLSLKVISPTEIKNLIAGYGRASKEQIKNNLPFFVNNPPNNPKEDESDAIAIAIATFLL